MHIRKLGASLTALGAVAALSACALSQGADDGGGAQEPAEVDGEITGEVSLQTWALRPRFTEYVENLIADFEEEYPGTEVTWLDQPGDGYSEKVLSQAEAGELPDVTNLPPDFALPLAEQNLLLDVASADETAGDTYVEGALGAYQYPGLDGTYGYPWYLNTDVNYWNVEMMEAAGLDPAAAPTTFDELLDQARTMHEETGDYLLSRKPGIGDFAAAGVPILNEDGTEFVFNTPGAVELLQQYVDAYEEGLMPQDVLTDAYLGNSEMFTQGEVAWSTGSGNFIEGVLENNPSMEGNIVATPAMDTPPMYVQGVSVARSSDNLATAVALAQFVTNAENQEAFAELVPGIFPSTTASQEGAAFESDGTPQGDAAQIAFESLPEAELLQPVQVSEAMTTYVNQQIAAAMNGDITAQEALDRSVEHCTELLQQ
ncbi:extracellular solute-binding protein [Georgenia alba]|uniref:Extracellular solute-binding protein n=1 Tax=Georgenia alba TaxID=2233858 RepID=A0ABW2Q8K7_9MICO